MPAPRGSFSHFPEECSGRPVSPCGVIGKTGTAYFRTINEKAGIGPIIGGEGRN